jgi:hypothetical protein
VTLKVLHRLLLRICGFAGRERAEIAAAPRLWVFLVRVQNTDRTSIVESWALRKSGVGLYGQAGAIKSLRRFGMPLLGYLLQVSSFESPANVGTHSLH